jgi:hypothetical protein
LLGPDVHWDYELNEVAIQRGLDSLIPVDLVRYGDRNDEVGPESPRLRALLGVIRRI